MLVSHKHKLIFVKTHKTSTQTFHNFMKEHLGPEDVMTGDPNHGTEINIDKKFYNKFLELAVKNRIDIRG